MPFLYSVCCQDMRPAPPPYSTFLVRIYYTMPALCCIWMRPSSRTLLTIPPYIYKYPVVFSEPPPSFAYHPPEGGSLVSAQYETFLFIKPQYLPSQSLPFLLPGAFTTVNPLMRPPHPRRVEKCVENTNFSYERILLQSSIEHLRKLF